MENKNDRRMTEEAEDLELYIDNDGELYNKVYVPLLKNMCKKWNEGEFDVVKCAQGLKHLVELGAKKYVWEFAHEPGPEPWDRVFVAKDRIAVQVDIARRINSMLEHNELFWCGQKKA